MNREENEDFLIALDQYYKLKSTYENNYDKDKIKIIKDTTKSWKEKRQEFKTLKPKCINCKRPVGTRFTRTYDNEQMCTFLKAVCGSLSEPCNLNIDLKSTDSLLYPETIKEFEDVLNENKRNIINDKNKLIFGYITSEEAVDLFDKIRENIQDASDLLAYYLEEYIQIVDNKEKSDNLKEDVEKSYIMVNDMKALIQKYDETNQNTQLIQDVVSIYVNQLMPLLEEIREKKYSRNVVEYNADTNTYHLIQQKNTIQDISFFQSEPEIISFQMGVEKKHKDKSNKQTNKQTIKQTNIIIEDESEDMLEEEPSEQEPLEQTKESLEEDPVYQQIWKSLDDNYRKVLEEDPEWLKETMEAYVKSRKENHPREFVLPTNIILPPIQMDDGKLDFGNENFNNIINKLPKLQRDIILTFKPISMMETQLKKILAQQFRLSKQ